MSRLPHLACLLLLTAPAHAEIVPDDLARSAKLISPLPRPLTEADFHPTDPAQVRIGQLLFHDKILSGNRNISCATCHAAEHGSSDGLSLGIGEGGTGVGPERTVEAGGIEKRIPRNAQGLWNLGARDIHTFFHDGRLTVSDIYGTGYDSPAEEWLPEGLPTPLAAQALFPLTSEFEMAGQPEENEVAGATYDRIDAAWPILAKRVRVIPDYGEMFVAAFDGIDTPDEVTIVEIATALGAYMTHQFRSDDSPFDAWLAGDDTALGPLETEGMELFYGRSTCASCHSGPLFTDQQFHALALPQFGPGRTRRFDPMPRDVGRMGKSDALADAYRFRTPPLRNVALTPPYGHNGAYPTLRGIVAHHADPLGGLDRWTLEEAALPDLPWLAAVDGAIAADRLEAARHRARVDIAPVPLSEHDLDALVAFLGALTGESAESPRLPKPATVPSGLPVD